MPGVTDFNNPAYPHYKNEAGHSYLPGKCECQTKDELKKEIMPLIEPVIKGLAELDNIICAMSMSIFETLATVAIDAIPGAGEVQAGIDASVVAAKTFDQNMLTPQDYFNEYVGRICDVKDWNFNIPLVFGKLKGASATRGISKGWMQEKSSICKDAESSSTGKERDKGKDKDDDKDKKTATKDKEEPKTTTKKNEPQTTSKNQACKRAGKNDGSDGCPITESVTDWSTVLRTVAKTCTASHHSQACYHYHSVEQNYDWIPRHHTCTDKDDDFDRDAKGLVATKHWENQHTNGVWREYRTAAYQFNGKDNPGQRPVKCERDEWPPAEFMKKDTPQAIRWKLVFSLGSVSSHLGEIQYLAQAFWLDAFKARVRHTGLLEYEQA